MQQNSLTERITRSLAYMLRHQPEEFDLELDNHGFAEVEDVVCALNERLGEPVREEDVVEALAAGDRPRYEIQGGRIRALYGHSIAIDPGEPSEPPELLYIGLSAIDAGRAARNGLQGGRRTFLHLAKTRADAEETARRLGGDWAVITVNARAAFEDGVNFYDRQALFLSDFIPTDFLDVGEVQRGTESPSRGGHGHRREGYERRGHDRGGHDRGGHDRGGHDRGGQDRRGDREHRGRDTQSAPERGHDDRRGELVPRRPSRAPADAPRAESDTRERRPAEVNREAPPRRSAPPSTPAPSGGGSSFGRGIYELAPEPPAPPRERRAEPEPTQEPEPERETASNDRDSASGFGAGIA
jgi:putative RNA 2'-phosphotransferase